MIATDLRRKLARLLVIRALISTVLLGSATIAQITAPETIPGDRVFQLIGVTYALTIASAATLRAVDRHRWLIDLQLAGDAVVVSAFIYFTGGIVSYCSSLYILPILAASTVQFRRGGILIATFSAVLYGGLVLAQYLTASGLLHDPWLMSASIALPPRASAGYICALNVFGFFAVAVLSGSLAEGVRSAGARLERASTRIADLQALNQHVIDSLPSGLATSDPSQRVVTFNRAAEAITGTSFRAAVGRPIGEVLQLPPSILETVRSNLTATGARRVEFPYRRGGGSEVIDLGLSVTSVQTPGGPAGSLFTFQDVTQIKKLERDVQMKRQLAAVGEMAAGIAHEIRNPLASMSGSIQILRQELSLSAEQAQLMDIVLRESERLNSTIQSFLAYARPQRSTVARFDVRRAINDTALLLRNSTEAKNGHVVEVDLPPSELWYEADEGQIKQIAWNLATNGMRAMPGGGRLCLGAAMEYPSEDLVITVRDEGLGIAVEELDRLFQPFQGSFAKGSGLGLAIVHRIVTGYNGEVRVSSRPGAGTTVSVRLPARAVVPVSTA